MKLCFPLMLKALPQHFLDETRILPLFQETAVLLKKRTCTWLVPISCKVT